jgi:hypothetical protein
MSHSNPFDFMRPMLEASRILTESQTVIGLRLSGMAGFWPMEQAETGKMVMEKLQASVASAGAMMQAGMAGKGLNDIAMAAMKPVRRQTRVNARRLTRKSLGK